MDNWIIINKIKKGEVKYNIGDEVFCFRRKKNGYPMSIKDNNRYFIKRLINDDRLSIACHSSDNIGWLQHINIHKTYVIPRSEFRDIVIDKILE